MVFLQAVILALRSVVYTMEIVLVLRMLCEMVVVRRSAAPMKFLIQISEPLLKPARWLLERIYRKSGIKMRMDLSPLVAMIFLYLINRLLD